MSTTEGVDWTPERVDNGWFDCRVRIVFQNHYAECHSDIVVRLWYNKHSVRGPWFIGTPGKCAELPKALPASQVIGLAS